MQRRLVAWIVREPDWIELLAIAAVILAAAEAAGADLVRTAYPHPTAHEATGSP